MPVGRVVQAVLALTLAPPAAAGRQAVPAGSTAAVHARPEEQSEVSGYLVEGSVARVTCRVPGTDRVRIEAFAGHLVGYVPIAALAFVAEPGEQAAVPRDFGPAGSPTLAGGRFRYVGSEACTACHLHEHRVRQDDPHRTALAGLDTEAARAAGAAHGVAEPARDPRCVKCHVTAYGAAPESLAGTFDGGLDSVGCEACHGPGGEYMRLEVHAVSRRKAIEAGMTDLSTLEQRDALCRRCHNELSPTYKRFDLKSFGDAIRHWPAEGQEAWRAFYLARVEAQPAEAAHRPPTLTAPPADLPECAPAPVATPVPVATASPVRIAARPSRRPSPPEERPDRPPVPNPSPTPKPPPGPGPRPPAAPQADPPEITLGAYPDARRPATRFPHRAHAHEYQTPVACGRCHHTHEDPLAIDRLCRDCHLRPGPAPPGEPRPAEGAFHGLCKGCHLEANLGPTLCAQCHPPPP